MQVSLESLRTGAMAHGAGGRHGGLHSRGVLQHVLRETQVSGVDGQCMCVGKYVWMYVRTYVYVQAYI